MKEYIITLKNRSHNIVIKRLLSNSALVEVNGIEYEVGIERKIKRQVEPLEVKPTKITDKNPAVATPAKRSGLTASGNDIIAPLPGLVLKILVREGEAVRSNQTLMKMEAMKMENEIKSDRIAIVKKIMVKEGEAVLENTPLIALESK